MTMWKINSGRGSRFTTRFVESGVVAVGVDEETDFTHCSSRDEIMRLLEQKEPHLTERQVIVGASQLWRFLTEVKLGDAVLVYGPETRHYHLGAVEGPAEFRLGLIPAYPLCDRLNG